MEDTKNMKIVTMVRIISGNPSPNNSNTNNVDQLPTRSPSASTNTNTSTSRRQAAVLSGVRVAEKGEVVVSTLAMRSAVGLAAAAPS